MAAAQNGHLEVVRYLSGERRAAVAAATLQVPMEKLH
jgi:hypothetical protein